MKFIVLLFIVLLFTATPVVLFNSLVMPELMSLKETYQHAEQIAADTTGY